MTDEPTNRQAAGVARKAAEIIQKKGKATGVLRDAQGRVCTFGAIRDAETVLDLPMTALAGDQVIYRMMQHPDVRAYLGTRKAPPWSLLGTWSDLPATTEAVIAKTFLQVADDLEVAP